MLIKSRQREVKLFFLSFFPSFFFLLIGFENIAKLIPPFSLKNHAMCNVFRNEDAEALFLSLGSSHGKPLTPIVVSLIFILAFAG